MPCYDDRNSPSEVRAETQKDFRHNSPVAEMLCFVLTNIDKADIATMPEEIQVWWKEHQIRDANKEKS